VPETYEYWDPNDWEQYVFGLLQDRHGVLNISKVPARHKGDFGLDYYSLSASVVYQCHAVQEPCDVATRATKQKAKITQDLGKFCRQKAQLQKIFGPVQMSRWILVVPLHDSAEVNAHATRKSFEVRAIGLPYAAVDFEVLVHDVSAFDSESIHARSARRATISIPSNPPSPQEVDDWCDASANLLTTLSRKLRKRVTFPDDDVDTMAREVVAWLLEKENALEALRQAAPDLHEAILDMTSRRLNRLTLYGPVPHGSASDVLRDTFEELMAEMRATIPNFSAASAHTMVQGTLADWLMRCPLDFPPYPNAI
jgi:hypothetical protein